jgi:hypothetical protein
VQAADRSNGRLITLLTMQFTSSAATNP